MTVKQLTSALRPWRHEARRPLTAGLLLSIMGRGYLLAPPTHLSLGQEVCPAQ